MADVKGIGDAVNSLGTAITSPGKLVFAAFVLLVALGEFGSEECWGGVDWLVLLIFFGVSGVFLWYQRWHDDYMRIVLNEKARLESAIALSDAVAEGKIRNFAVVKGDLLLAPLKIDGSEIKGAQSPADS